MRILGAALLSLPLLGVLTSVSEAQKKTAAPGSPGSKTVGACGVKILPLVEGNTWTYEFVISDAPPRDDLIKLTPNQPGKVVITVKKIEPQGTDTLVTLEEKTTADISKERGKHIYDERTITSTILCNPKTKFEISPESFFFAGEPGGVFGLAFDKVERLKDTSWKLVNGNIGDAQWREDIVAHFTRTATTGAGATFDSGKIELERQFTPAQPERLSTKPGVVYTAERLVLTTTGRVTLDHPAPDTKAMDLPAGWINQLWLAPNVGVVQVQNAYAHKYLLTEMQLK